MRVGGSTQIGATPGVGVALLGGFDLSVGDHPISLSAGSERLLAFVALSCRPVPRAVLAGTLWPDAPQHRAYASLRSALSRLRRVNREALEVCPTVVRLARGVSVDLYRAQSMAYSILDPTLPTDGVALRADAVTDLSLDLLPGWYDDWAVLKAEAWRQLRLHALEALAGEFTSVKRFADAVAAAGAAVRADPLRESANAALIRAHLAEGNQSEALYDLERYDELLQTELGLRPSPQLVELVPACARSRLGDGDSNTA